MMTNNGTQGKILTMDSMSAEGPTQDMRLCLIFSKLLNFKSGHHGITKTRDKAIIIINKVSVPTSRKLKRIPI